MIYRFLQPVKEQQSKTVSIKYKYLSSTRLQNFVNDSAGEEKNNFVSQDTLHTQNYKIIPARFLENFALYPLIDEAARNKHRTSYKYSRILTL
jgi:hypothetical protein